MKNVLALAALAAVVVPAAAHAQEVKLSAGLEAQGTQLNRADEPAYKNLKATGYGLGFYGDVDYSAGPIYIGLEAVGHGSSTKATQLYQDCTLSSCGVNMKEYRTIENTFDAALTAHVGVNIGNAQVYVFGGYKVADMKETYKGVYASQPTDDYQFRNTNYGFGPDYGIGGTFWFGDTSVGLRYEESPLVLTRQDHNFKSKIDEKIISVRVGHSF